MLRGRGSPFHSVVPSIVSQNGGANQYGKRKPPRNVDGKRNVQKALNRMDKESTKENEDPNTHCPGECASVKKMVTGKMHITSKTKLKV